MEAREAKGKVRRYIFGFDAADPERGAAELREKGFDAVVLGGADAPTTRALERAGIELYLCYGAFGLGGADEDPERWARDAAGRKRRWFGSGCPNDEALAQARLDAALERLRATPSARGLFVDGARFASFASSEGPEAFFTCFCPRCTARMRALGFDPERLTGAAQALMRSRGAEEASVEALGEWFAFRQACMRAYFDRFAAAVHALPGNRLACGFVFAPSLGGFVGQTGESVRALDVVAPMLYRAYPHAEGPACLGHEWEAAQALFDGRTLPRLAALAGVEKALVPAQGIEAQVGFPAARVGEETAAARSGLRTGQALLPILQIEDEHLAGTAAAAMEAGAAGYGLFMYGQAALPRVG